VSVNSANYCISLLKISVCLNVCHMPTLCQNG